MNQVLTIAEIRARYDSQWVLVDEPQTNESLEVQGGTVLFHSKDRDEVYRKAAEFRPKRFAMINTGKLPKDAVVVL